MGDEGSSLFLMSCSSKATSFPWMRTTSYSLHDATVAFPDQLSSTGELI